MARKFTTAQSRRDFLKRSSALAALGITTSLTPDLAFGQAKTDLRGVTIDYWNMIGVQNKIVRQISEDIVNAFQQKTGCTVNVTWNSYGDIIGPKYRTNFTGGIMPTVMDTSSRWVNQLREFLLPLNDYVDNAWEPDARAGVEWLFPLNAEENRGFPTRTSSTACRSTSSCRRPTSPAATTSSKPASTSTRTTRSATPTTTSSCARRLGEGRGALPDRGLRQDLGLRRHPVERLDPLAVDRGQRLPERRLEQEQCPLGGLEAGRQFYVDVFRKHQLSSPNSPQSTDEDTVDQFILGRKSIVHCDILNRGTLLDRMPDEMADGTVVWGPHFPMTGGTSGSQCFLGPNSFYIVADEGPDAEIKWQASWEFIKEWFLPENMTAVAKSSGLCARRDLWEQLKGEPDRSIEASIETIGDNPGMWTGHPRSVDFQYNLWRLTARGCCRAPGSRRSSKPTPTRWTRRSAG